MFSPLVQYPSSLSEKVSTWAGTRLPGLCIVKYKYRKLVIDHIIPGDLLLNCESNYDSGI